MQDGGPIQNLRTEYINMGAMIDDPCQFDTLSFYDLETQFDYYLRQTAVPAFYRPGIQQQFALCPITCSYVRENELDYPESVIDSLTVESVALQHPSVESQRAVFLYSSADKALHQRFMVFTLTCVSERSNEVNGIIEHSFRVDFIDECVNTVITPAYNDDIVIPLFQFFYEPPLVYSTQSLDCAPIKYSLFITGTTAPSPVTIFWNLGYNDYELNPTDFDNRGTYQLLLRSCVPITGDDPVCVVSETWELTIFDPCLETTISESGWTYIMSAAQLGTEVMNFADRIVFEGGDFPWVTGLDVSSGVNEICGPIIYSIQAVSYVENFANPLIV